MPIPDDPEILRADASLRRLTIAVIGVALLGGGVAVLYTEAFLRDMSALAETSPAEAASKVATVLKALTLDPARPPARAPSLLNRGGGHTTGGDRYLREMRTEDLRPRQGMRRIIADRWARRAHAGLLRELQSAIAFTEDARVAQHSAPGVSGWSIQQHLEHLWRADTSIVGWLAAVCEGSAGSDGPGSTVPGAVVMWLGRIPRGKGRTPEFARPAGAPLSEVAAGFRAIRADVELLGESLGRLVSAEATRRHHLLGCYDAVQWLRFAHIHHVHHRRIIEDIRRAAN